MMETIPDPFLSSSSLRNASARARSEVMSVCGAHRSEHAHNVSKWRPTVSLATKCAEKVWPEHFELR